MMNTDLRESSVPTDNLFFERTSDISASRQTLQKFALTTDPKRFRALDLYSGVGGWGLGLMLAGIDVVASYEKAEAACKTQSLNQGRPPNQCDIRRLHRSHLPKSVDIVVGSPPCTQFSFSNRGGNGDIADGLRDIGRFLWVVDRLKPRYWVLENVPRVKAILEEHLFTQRGRLRRFRHLFRHRDVHIEVIDMSKYGLPQRRLRCIAGRFPSELLREYAEFCPRRALDDVLRALGGDPVVDPIYGFHIPRDQLIDHEVERDLSPEEFRLNRDAKMAHPIYNMMSFPDRTDRPVRAITATCTRVSRESIIISSRIRLGAFRRLTLRERACAQGFPITYQFFGRTFTAKLGLIGNAIPPLFVYYLGCAVRGVPAHSLVHPDATAFRHENPPERPPVTAAISKPGRLPANRRFRAVIPTLRLKSGVRFELANHFCGNEVKWRVSFFFGTSKKIRRLRLDNKMAEKMFSLVNEWRMRRSSKGALQTIRQSAANCSAEVLQSRWSKRSDGPGPHVLVDAIDDATKLLAARFEKADAAQRIRALQGVSGLSPMKSADVAIRRVSAISRKFSQNSAVILAGLLVGSCFNVARIAKPAAPRSIVE